MSKPETILLAILDGWGLNPSETDNAVFLARTPYLDRLMATYPTAQLQCSGEAVGLPAGIMGNSEVGHLNIGAGRVVFQDLLKIDRAIEDGSFFENAVIQDLMDTVKKRRSSLHLMGLLSDGGVHSQLGHLFALLEMARNQGLTDVVVHVIGKHGQHRREQCPPSRCQHNRVFDFVVLVRRHQAQAHGE